MILTECFRKSVSIERIRDHIQALEGVRHPLAEPEALEHAADYIAETLGSMGYEMDEQHFPDNGRTFRNVIATRRGLHRPHERIAVMAHYDTVAGSPGADDNASGVAVMLETARVLARFSFERTVHLIGVSLEENENNAESCSGTRGSRALAAHARENGWSIEGVVVLESVAYAGDCVVQTVPAGTGITVPEIGNFVAVVGNERSKELIDGFVRAVERYRPDLPHVVLTVPGNGELLPDSRRSDHAPFWDEGFKAIMVTDTTNFRSPHYHLPSDTLATLNLEFAAKVCCATAGVILELARPTQ
ncbi:MAG: M20/M25/M40 family metallo-hydrolase [Desulfuromonadales bacterium]|nr:M20/M25/M40 family metallo-hydrolase [Desulfuromonadales bacterium]